MATSRHGGDNLRSRPKKVVPLNIRVASLEKAAFVRAAEIAGVPVSSWIRERLRAAAFRELDNVGEIAPFFEMPRSGGENE